MLVYEKRCKKDLRIKVDQSLVCDSTARSSDLPHALQVFPGLSAQIEARQEGATEVMVPFYGATKFIPNSVFRQVHSDNDLFRAEQ